MVYTAESMMTKVGVSVVGLLLLTAAISANADSFTFTGPGTTISFTLPGTVTNPNTVSSVYSGPPLNGFEIDNVSMLINGVPATWDIAFFSTGLSGGLDIFSFSGSTLNELANQMGPQLFSINSTNPWSFTFVPGTYNLLFYSGSIANDLSLTITSPVSPVPEPSTVLLFGSGLAGLVGAVRRKLRA